MGIKRKNKLKKFLTEALVACLLLAPTVLPPAESGEADMPGKSSPGASSQGRMMRERMESGPAGIGKTKNSIKIINKLVLW